ncbi:MAG: TIGR03545 family protein [Planctomycetes bacterium]|nr:TIGR03545 family protein [Planctomycetota bacterium]
MRWKAIIAVAVITLLISACNILFLDSTLKSAVVSLGQTVMGAKIEIDSLDTKFSDCSVTLKNVRVADKANPMTNLFEFEEAVFDARFLPLFEKKVVIDRATVKGIKMGTPRTTSGALPEAQQGSDQSATTNQQLPTKALFSLDKFTNLQSSLDPKSLIKPEELSSIKTAENAKGQVDQISNEIQTRVGQLDVDGKINSIQTRIDEMNKIDEGNKLKTIKKKLDAGKSIKKDTEGLKSEINSARDFANQKMDSANKLVDDVSNMKEQDWKSIESKLQLPQFDSGSAAQMLFGPDIMKKYEMVIGFVKSSRSSVPSSETKPPKPKRGNGRIVEFPNKEQLPAFLLLTAGLSGELGSQPARGFSGTIEGLNSNPPIYGKPTTMLIESNEGDLKFMLKVVLDYVREQKETININSEGFPMQNLAFGNPDSLGLLIKSGKGKLVGSAELAGENVNGEFQLDGENLAVEPQLKDSDSSEAGKRLRESLMASLSNIKTLTVKIKISGKMGSPDLKIESTIDSVIADALKGAFSGEIEKQKAALRQQFDGLVDGKTNELRSQIGGSKEGHLSAIDGKNKQVDSLVDRVEKELSKLK